MGTLFDPFAGCRVWVSRTRIINSTNELVLPEPSLFEGTAEQTNEQSPNTGSSEDKNPDFEEPSNDGNGQVSTIDEERPMEPSIVSDPQMEAESQTEALQQADTQHEGSEIAQSSTHSPNRGTSPDRSRAQREPMRLRDRSKLKR